MDKEVYEVNELIEKIENNNKEELDNESEVIEDFSDESKVEMTMGEQE